MPTNHVHGPPHSANICYNFAFYFSLQMKRRVKAFQNLVPYVQSVHDSFGDVVIGSLWNTLYILAYVVFVTFLFCTIAKINTKRWATLSCFCLCCRRVWIFVVLVCPELRHTSGSYLRNGGICHL